MDHCQLTVRDVFLTADPEARQARLRQLANTWLRTVARQASV